MHSTLSIASFPKILVRPVASGPRTHERAVHIRCQAASTENTMSILSNAIKISDDKTAVKDSVKNYYGEVLETSDDLKTSACCTAVAPEKAIREALKGVPQEIKAKYYGCGSPFPVGIEGLRVLDLGSGSGRDCYVCSKLVGESGSVVGVDMTRAQLDVAEKYVDEYTKQLGYAEPNMRFVEGTIEDIAAAGVEPESVDLAISNCVINLSPDKESVLKGVWDALAPGGEMYFSDVYADRRVPEALRSHPELLGECLGGALYVQDFLRLCHQVGFADPRIMSSNTIDVRDETLKELCGEIQFYSITYRLFKLPGRLETLCEDYGQVATYKGTIPGRTHAYELDDHHKFVAGKPMLVCGNTASMVGETYLGKHFDVVGDRAVHFGEFDCSGPPGAAAAAEGGQSSAGCC